MKKIVAFVLFLIGFWGCKSPNPKHTDIQIQKDSIVTKVNYIPRDTTIVIPGDIMELKVPVYNLTEVPITVQTSKGTLELSKLNEEILAKCNIDDLQMIITLQDKLISEYQEKLKTKSETIEVRVKYIPKWVQFLAAIGAMAILYFIYRIISFLKLKQS